MTVRPIKRFVLLYDDQPEYSEGGIVVRKELGCDHMDFIVVAVGETEDADFGPGDRVVVSDPNVGRRVMLDGTVFRLVRVTDVLAAIEE
jgi:co-chaperonin GroES (HSP10)